MNCLMWYLVQQSPGETIALSNSESYERLKFQLMNKQRFNSKCFYEIIHSSDLVAGPDYVIDKNSGELIFEGDDRYPTPEELATV